MGQVGLLHDVLVINEDVRMKLWSAFQIKVLLFLCLGLSMSTRQLIFLLAPPVFAISPGNASQGSQSSFSLEPMGLYFHSCLVQRLLGKHKGVTLGLSTQPGNGPSVYLAAKASNSISPFYNQKAIFFSLPISGHCTSFEILQYCV